MAGPSVSVVIPSYNRAQELTRALESIAAQSEPPDEVIVCDDGSETPLWPVVDGFNGRLPIQYFRIENSGGPACPRNVAARAATSEWLSFLDSDDWWTPDKLTRLKATARTTDAEVIYHPLRLASGSRERLRGRHATVGERFSPWMSPLEYLLCVGNPIANAGASIRRDAYLALGGVDEDLGVVDDYDLWIRGASRGIRFHHLPEVLGFYWVSHDNISTEPLRQIKVHHETLTRHRHHLPPHLQRSAAAFEAYMTGTFFVTAGNLVRARAELRQATPLRTWKLRLARLVKLARLSAST